LDFELRNQQYPRRFLWNRCATGRWTEQLSDVDKHSWKYLMAEAL